MKPKHLAEKEKDQLLLLKPGCHQRVTLVGSCYKVPSKRSTSKQEMDISKAKRFSDWYDLVLKIKPCKWSFINAAMRTISCAASLCTSISTSGVLKRSTNAMIVQTSDIYMMCKYLHDASVNLPSYCTFCVMTV